MKLFNRFFGGETKTEKQMITYLVTTEIKTPWWKALFRWFRIIPPREEFCLQFHSDWACKGAIVSSGHEIKIIKKL